MCLLEFCCVFGCAGRVDLGVSVWTQSCVLVFCLVFHQCFISVLNGAHNDNTLTEQEDGVILFVLKKQKKQKSVSIVS